MTTSSLTRSKSFSTLPPDQASHGNFDSKRASTGDLNAASFSTVARPTQPQTKLQLLNQAHEQLQAYMQARGSQRWGSTEHARRSTPNSPTQILSDLMYGLKQTPGFTTDTTGGRNLWHHLQTVGTHVTAPHTLAEVLLGAINQEFMRMNQVPVPVPYSNVLAGPHGNSASQTARATLFTGFPLPTSAVQSSQPVRASYSNTNPSTMQPHVNAAINDTLGKIQGDEYSVHAGNRNWAGPTDQPKAALSDLLKALESLSIQHPLPAAARVLHGYLQRLHMQSAVAGVGMSYAQMTGEMRRLLNTYLVHQLLPASAAHQPVGVQTGLKRWNSSDDLGSTVEPSRKRRTDLSAVIPHTGVQPASTAAVAPIRFMSAQTGPGTPSVERVHPSGSAMPPLGSPIRPYKSRPPNNEPELVVFPPLPPRDFELNEASKLQAYRRELLRLILVANPDFTVNALETAIVVRFGKRADGPLHSKESIAGMRGQMKVSDER